MATIRKRKTKDGELRYQVQVRMRGYRPESASFERLTDARKWEQNATGKSWPSPTNKTPLMTSMRLYDENEGRGPGVA